MSSKSADSKSQVYVDEDATIHLSATAVPFSEFASPEAKAAFLSFLDFYHSTFISAEGISAQRRAFSQYVQPALTRTRKLYSTDSAEQSYGGVLTDVYAPRGEAGAQNQQRVLINLHGGGFSLGARVMGALESIPVASVSGIPVVSVDYRQGPESKYPAATQDVVTVYEALLHDHKPENIGIYGCSAGGVLAGQVIAWLTTQQLPRPGAVGLFCASARGWTGGDSQSLGVLLQGRAPPEMDESSASACVDGVPYLRDADFSDPLVTPIRSSTIMASFPPTLIISSTRDMALSSASYTHTRLVDLDVTSELHVWEGMSHAFFTMAPDLPESQQAIRVISRFFSRRLGPGAASQEGQQGRVT